MSTPHIRPLAVAFGKAWRLAGPNSNSKSTRSKGKARLMVTARRKDLDAWADILGVDNDADAMTALSNYYGRLLTVAGELNWFQKRFETSGVVGGDDILVFLNDAATDTLNAADGLRLLRRSFERHERGVA